jgi:hypothetical protein
MPVNGTKLRNTAVALLAICVLPLLPAPLLAQDGVPDLSGSWSGKGTGVVFGNLGHQEAAPEPRFKDRTVTWTLDIDRQEGSGLIGTWSSPNHSETLIGVVRSDNRTVHFVDEDSHFSGIIRSENEMEVCLQESTGESMVATCYILQRQ